MEKLMHIIRETKAYAPKVTEIKSFAPDGVYTGISAITYTLPDALGGKFKTFAYVGIPSGKQDVPAVVLVHGGNGHAFLEWVKKWNDRGYAAIAMDLEGYYPETKNAGANWTDGMWHHGEYGLFDEGETPSPKNDSMENHAAPLEKQWMTHAVCKVIAARRILCDLAQTETIGIVGVSWGAVITALVLGWENRFDFAVPIYGAGYMGKNLAHLGMFFRPTAVQKYWLAETRFDQLNMPCLWMGWDDDPNFSVNCNSLSFLATCKQNQKTRIVLLHNFSHGHKAASECGEVYAFADWAAKGAASFPVLCLHGNLASVCHAEKVCSVMLYYLEKPMQYAMFDKFGSGVHSYMTENWKSVPCETDGCTARIHVPKEAKDFYIAAEVACADRPLHISSVLYEREKTVY